MFEFFPFMTKFVICFFIHHNFISILASMRKPVMGFLTTSLQIYIWIISLICFLLWHIINSNSKSLFKSTSFIISAKNSTWSFGLSQYLCWITWSYTEPKRLQDILLANVGVLYRRLIKIHLVPRQRTIGILGIN